MKKKFVIGIIAVVLLGGAGAFAFFKMKGGNTKKDKKQTGNVYADIKIESATMPDMFLELYRKSNPFSLHSRNDEMTAALEKELAKDPNNLELKWWTANQNLDNGTTQRAIDLFEELEKDDKFMKDPKNNKAEKEKLSKVDSLASILAVSYLRLGEQQNCIENRNAYSCVFPIHGAGVHVNKKPVEVAIDRYLAILKKNPKDYLSIWLLNVACQANGSVPASVSPAFIIPQSRYPDQWKCPRFNEIAIDLGVENTGWAGGICSDDFDNDGYIDIMSSGAQFLDNVKYFHNNGDGTFSDWTEKAGLKGETEGLDITQVDFNNDGWMDFMIPRGGWKYEAGHLPPSLMRNNGDGTFTDVTIQAGLMNFNPAQVTEWADYDNDGDVDLFLGHEMYYPSVLYNNNGDGTFTDVSKKSGLNVEGYVKSANWGDYDNDGNIDIYVSNFENPGKLYHNNGNGSFTDVTEKAGVPANVSNFPCWWFDYNNDGLLDLYVSAYRPIAAANSCREYMGIPMKPEYFPCLYKNNGNGTFTNVSTQCHLNYETFTMGCNFGDLDNDGWLDFYLGVGAPDYRAIFPNRMFHNHEGQFFEDCSYAGGFAQLQKGHAISFTDFDFDGDQDIYADFGGFFTGDVYENALYENPGFGNNWINVKFVGVKSNRSGIGTRVKLTFTDAGKKRSTYFSIGKGASFGSNPIRLQAGVSKATVIDEMEVYWPTSKTKSIYKNVPVNKVYEIKEGDAAPSEINVKAFQFQTNERRMQNGDTTKMQMHHTGMKM